MYRYYYVALLSMKLIDGKDEMTLYIVHFSKRFYLLDGNLNAAYLAIDRIPIEFIVLQ